MGSLSAADISDRVRTALDAELPDWLEARAGFDSFPGREASEIADRCWAVFLPITAGTEAHGRQRSTVGKLCETTVNVRASFTLRHEDEPFDLSRGLGLEPVLVAAVLTTGKDPDLSVVFEGVTNRQTRDIGAERVLVVECRFSVMHFYPLA